MEFNELIRDLKCIARYHIPGTEMRKDVDDVVERVVYLLEAQQARIDELEAELKEEMYRHDRVQDFEVAEAQVLAKLREERRWIPVTERLPEEDTRVLVWLTDIVGTYTKVDTDRLKNNRWVKWGQYVTYWMPLQEPPKEDA